jgi:peptidoglycan-associated lipoprotein
LHFLVFVVIYFFDTLKEVQTMSHIKLLTAVALLLSVGFGTACKPPLPPEEQVDASAEEARRLAEEEARRKAQEEAEAARRAQEEADALRKAQEDARREAERLAAEARAALEAAAALALVDVNFDYNQDSIRRADRLKLQAIADFMKEFPVATVLIEGHCDERGTIEYNQALGERRAYAAQSYLVGLGISEARFTTLSFGKERPKVMGDSERSWFQNRRCEFKLQTR